MKTKVKKRADRKLRNKPNKAQAAAQRGKPSNRLGKKSVRTAEKSLPVSARTVNRPSPDLKPWPVDSVQIVAPTLHQLRVNKIRGRIVDHYCSDCFERLAVDSHLIARAQSLPARDGRPLKYLCTDCFKTYNRSGIKPIVGKATTQETECDEQ